MTVQILTGDCRKVLKTLAAGSVHCAVTSPPYFGLRDYGTGTWIGGDPDCQHVVGELRHGKGLATSRLTTRGGGIKAGLVPDVKAKAVCPHCDARRVDEQIGLEETPAEFIAEMVSVFREVWRVLRDDGTLWVNIGDSYANDTKWGGSPSGKNTQVSGRQRRQTGLKSKDLIGIPWRLALALRDDGWYLRQDIIWHKPNPMPESILDRCTKAHEYLFLFAKNEKYFFDAEAISEAASENTNPRAARNGGGAGGVTPKTAPRDETNVKANVRFAESTTAVMERRNKRSVWTVATQPFSEAHFATFPPDLIEPAIMAGTSARGCCAKCGAPWKRVTVEVETGKTQKMPDGMATYAGAHSAIHRDGREKGASDNPVMARETIGWYPACRCDALAALPTYERKPGRAGCDHEEVYKAKISAWRLRCRAVDAARRDLCTSAASIRAVPAVVLDPFGGAGTAGLVADRLQRDAILIELNPAYAEMARGRIFDDAPLFQEAAQ